MIKQNIWQTPFGFSLVGNYRENKNDWNTIQSILKEDEYRMKELCIKPKIAIDLGGHVGAWSILAAKLGAEEVHTVEILPENIELIKKNAADNGLSDKIKIYNKAIGKTSGEEVTAYYMDTNTKSGDHHEFVGHVGNYDKAESGRSFLVKTISLDDLLAPFEKVSIVKTDCEGGEWPALEGASSETLNKIEVITGEVHIVAGKSLDHLKKLLYNFEDISHVINNNGKHIDLIAFRNKNL